MLTSTPLAFLPLFIAATAFVPVVASAQESPTSEATDSVRLHNGGLYRGRVTEVLPGDHVTIVTEGAETKRIPWPEVEQLILPSSARPKTEAPVPTPLTGPLVRVHISSKTHVNLHRRPVGALEWVEACVSPCDKELPAGDTYRVTGAGVTEREIMLHADGAKVIDIHVDPRSTLGIVGGGLLAGLGGSAAFLGFLALPTTCLGEKAGCNRKADGNGGTVGGILLAAGGAVALAGTLVMIRSSKTDIELSRDGKAKDTTVDHKREPTWRDTSRLDAPPLSLPLIFARTF